MNLKSIISILRDLKVMAFYKDNDTYKLDMSNMKSFNTRINKYLTDFESEYPAVAGTDQFTNIKAALNSFREDLSNISIPQAEFDEYLRLNKPSKTVQQYFDIKKYFTYQILPLMWADSRFYAVNDYVPSERNDSDEPKKHIDILNHNNPFSDITIENQKFLYPDGNHEFQTLEFNVGYTMSKIEEENSAALVVQPDFKISKSQDRNQVVNTITMDDTISSPMPDTQGDKELLYI